MMPGKSNSVLAMALAQIAFGMARAMHAVTLACASGQLDSISDMPLIAVSLRKALGMMQRAIAPFDEPFARPLAAERAARERHLLESTAIAPDVKAKIGYERTASLVAEAAASGARCYRFR
jgi:aspartate ammonia-lyase